MWNHHSVMFEITWCVILYSTVLSIEFAPIVLEKFNMHAQIKWVHSVSLPLMIIGVLLSTLHQSSFGSLYLIVPTRLHPLWYSPLLPVLFFISCIASGTSMIILETLIMSRNGRKLLAPGLRANLAKITAVALAVYLVVRFRDMAARGVLGHARSLSYHSMFFWAEILIGFVFPLGMLVSHRVRHSRRGLFIAAVMVLTGFAANRMNTAITGLESYPAVTYFPSLLEVLIMLGIAAIGFSAFYLIARFLPIFEDEPEAAPAPEALWPPRPAVEDVLFSK
jgi:Ni/Fe-hydrogenase subunit HybB-like protein